MFRKEAKKLLLLVVVFASIWSSSAQRVRVRTATQNPNFQSAQVPKIVIYQQAIDKALIHTFNASRSTDMHTAMPVRLNDVVYTGATLTDATRVKLYFQWGVTYTIGGNSVRSADKPFPFELSVCGPELSKSTRTTSINLRINPDFVPESTTSSGVTIRATLYVVIQDDNCRAPVQQEVYVDLVLKSKAWCMSWGDPHIIPFYESGEGKNSWETIGKVATNEQFHAYDKKMWRVLVQTKQVMVVAYHDTCRLDHPAFEISCNTAFMIIEKGQVRLYRKTTDDKDGARLSSTTFDGLKVEWAWNGFTASIFIEAPATYAFKIKKDIRMINEAISKSSIPEGPMCMHFKDIAVTTTNVDPPFNLAACEANPTSCAIPCGTSDSDCNNQFLTCAIPSTVLNYQIPGTCQDPDNPTPGPRPGPSPSPSPAPPPVPSPSPPPSSRTATESRRSSSTSQRPRNTDGNGVPDQGCAECSKCDAAIRSFSVCDQLTLTTHALAEGCNMDAKMLNELMAVSDATQAASISCFNLYLMYMNSTDPEDRAKAMDVGQSLGFSVVNEDCSGSTCLGGRTSSKRCVNGGKPRTDGLGCECPDGFMGYDCGIPMYNNDGSMSGQLIAIIAGSTIGAVAIAGGAALVIRRRRLREQQVGAARSSSVLEMQPPVSYMSRADSQQYLTERMPRSSSAMSVGPGRYEHGPSGYYGRESPVPAPMPPILNRSASGRFDPASINQGMNKYRESGSESVRSSGGKYLSRSPSGRALDSTYSDVQSTGSRDSRGGEQRDSRADSASRYNRDTYQRQ